MKTIAEYTNAQGLITAGPAANMNGGDTCSRQMAIGYAYQNDKVLPCEAQ